MPDNGLRTRRGQRDGDRPVVKGFTPDAAGVWLLSELDPDDPDSAFGLCDLGLGFPELGYVSLGNFSKLVGRWDWRLSVT